MDINKLFAPQPEVKEESPKPILHKKIGEIEVYKISAYNIAKIKELVEEAGKLSPDDEKGRFSLALQCMIVLTSIPFHKLTDQQLQDLMVRPSKQFLEAKKEVEDIVFNTIGRFDESVKSKPKISHLPTEIDAEFGDIKVYKMNPENGEKFLNFLANYIKIADPNKLKADFMGFDILDQIEMLQILTNLSDEEATTKIVMRDENCKQAVDYIVHTIIPQIMDDKLDVLKKSPPQERKQVLNAILSNKDYDLKLKIEAKKLFDKISKEEREADANG